MMRRRGPGGGMRPFRRGMRAGVNVPPAVQQADDLMDGGNYAAAAAEFETLGRGAEGRFPGRAPQFWLRAGKARILAGHAALAMEDLKRGLSLLAEGGKAENFQRAAQRAVAELKAGGLEAEAQEIAALFQGRAAAAAAPAQAGLPGTCPACGAPVRPEEVRRPNGGSAQCAYCGCALAGR